MIKTFISHASNDSFVNRLEERLKKENIGLDVFVDHYKNRGDVKVEDIPDSIGIKQHFEKYDRVKGKIWFDFSNEREWEPKYQELREAMLK